jgi:endonuclease/exonuclease/phosphatase family metal-dependent hydrolase
MGMGLIAAVLGLGSSVVDIDWVDGNPQISFSSAQIAKIGGYLTSWLDSAADPAQRPAPNSPDTPDERGLANAPGPSAGANTDAEVDITALPLPGQQQVQSPQQAPPARSGDTIKIATFNIQVFGTSKLKKPAAMQVLTDVVRRFDVVAIQEVRSTDDSVIPTFIQMINAAGARYDFVIGPRLGRTNSKEQYAIIFDTARIEVDRSSVYTVPDPQDLLHREPMVARFRVRGVPANQAFTFNLVDIHTDPDETKSELDALGDVYVGVQNNRSGEDDVILLGDLNVDEYHLGRLGQVPNITHAITKVTTNTRRNKMYDNIIFSRLATTEYVGRWGVLDLMSTFNMSEAQALEVSDHCPAWAEFSVYESGGSQPVARVPGNTR